MSFGEMALIAILAVLLFGKQLPEVSRSFGRTLRDIKKALDSVKSEVNAVTSDLNAEINADIPTSNRYPNEDASADREYARVRTHSAHSRHTSPVETDDEGDMSLAPRFSPPAAPQPGNHIQEEENHAS